jgi:hypothetical protein
MINANELTPAQQGAAPDRRKPCALLRSFLAPRRFGLPAAGELVVRPQRAAWQRAIIEI